MGVVKLKALPSFTDVNGFKHPAAKSREIVEPTDEQLEEFTEIEPQSPRGERPRGLLSILGRTFGASRTRVWSDYDNAKAQWEVRRAQQIARREDALVRKEEIRYRAELEQLYTAATRQTQEGRDALLESQLRANGLERVKALRLSSTWRKLDPLSFEANVAWLYRASGWDAELTQITNDRGVDICARRGSTLLVVQCKAHALPVGSPVIRELIGARESFRAQDAVLCTLNGVTAEGRLLAEDNRIKIFTAEGLSRWAEELQPPADIRA